MALKDGIPGADGVAFSERINMRDKLHQLEAARDYLVDKCPADLQEGYAIAKDPFLIRLVMEKVHPSYTTVIDDLTDKVKERKRREGVEVPENTHIEEYSDDWLPSWKDLKKVLYREYDRKVALWKADKSWKEPEALPVMFNADERAGGQDQSKLIQSWAGRCFACGRTGCRVGAAGCTAKAGELHPQLPEKHRAQRGVGLCSGVCTWRKLPRVSWGLS